MKALLFGMAVLLLVCGCSGTQESPGVLLKKSVAAAKKADWKSAGEFVEAARKQNPKNPDILLMSAIVLENLGRPEEAIDRIQQIPGEEKNFMVQYTLGRMLYRKGRYEQCIGPLAAALDIRERDLNTLVLLAKASSRLNTRNALKYFKMLLSFPEYRESPIIFNELGVCFALQNQPKNAVTMFRKAASGPSDFPVALLNEAIVTDFLLENRPEAAVLYNQYLRTTANRSDLDRERFAVTRRLQSIR